MSAQCESCKRGWHNACLSPAGLTTALGDLAETLGLAGSCGCFDASPGLHRALKEAAA